MSDTSVHLLQSPDLGFSFSTSKSHDASVDGVLSSIRAPSPSSTSSTDPALPTGASPFDVLRAILGSPHSAGTDIPSELTTHASLVFLLATPTWTDTLSLPQLHYVAEILASLERATFSSLAIAHALSDEVRHPDAEPAVVRAQLTAQLLETEDRERRARREFLWTQERTMFLEHCVGPAERPPSRPPPAPRFALPKRRRDLASNEDDRPTKRPTTRKVNSEPTTAPSAQTSASAIKSTFKKGNTSAPASTRRSDRTVGDLLPGADDTFSLRRSSRLRAARDPPQAAKPALSGRKRARA